MIDIESEAERIAAESVGTSQHHAKRRAACADAVKSLCRRVAGEQLEDATLALVAEVEKIEALLRRDPFSSDMSLNQRKRIAG